MSEQHTKEPWKVFERKLMYSIGGVEKMHTERTIGTEYDHPQLKAPYPICVVSTGLGAEPGQVHHFVSLKEENARRIVACVNACAGIPTYQLTCEDEEPNNLGGMIDALRTERDELLIAAKAVIDRWDSPAWKDQPHTGEFIARLREAIAKAEA